LMADPRPRSCQKGGGNSGLLGRSSLWTPDGARGGSCGWLWREVDPLRVVLRGNHWLPAPCVSSSGWLTASAKGTGVPGLSDVPSLLSASVPSALALAANQLTNAAVQGCTQHVSSASETEGGAEQQTRTSLNGRAGNAQPIRILPPEYATEWRNDGSAATGRVSDGKTLLFDRWFARKH
jgi:hypothetical protein